MMVYKKKKNDGYPCWGRTWNLIHEKSGRSLFMLMIQRDTADRPLNFFRIDFGLIGFGWSDSFSPRQNDGGWKCFINLYRGAPRFLRWFLPSFGWSGTSRWFETSWSGSQVEPFHAWSFQIGRLFFGNDTPKWLQVKLMERLTKQWASETGCEPDSWYDDGTMTDPESCK